MMSSNQYRRRRRSSSGAFVLYQSGRRGGLTLPYAVTYRPMPFFAAHLSCPPRMVIKAMMQNQSFGWECDEQMLSYGAETLGNLLGAPLYNESALRKIQRAMGGRRMIGLRITHHLVGSLLYTSEEIGAIKQIVMDQVFPFLKLDDIFVETTVRYQQNRY